MTTNDQQEVTIDILENVNKLIIKPLHDIDNTYIIEKVKDDGSKEHLFTAYGKNTESCQCCKNLSPVSVRIYYYNPIKKSLEANPLIVLDRSMNQTICLCCLQMLNVQSPPGSIIGRVQQACSILQTLLLAQDVNRQTLQKLTSALCICTNLVTFMIRPPDNYESVIGKVQANLVQPDYFLIEYPLSSLVKSKAILLGGAFLVYMMYAKICPNTVQIPPQKNPFSSTDVTVAGSTESEKKNESRGKIK